MFISRKIKQHGRPGVDGFFLLLVGGHHNNNTFRSFVVKCVGRAEDGELISLLNKCCREGSFFVVQKEEAEEEEEDYEGGGVEMPPYLRVVLLCLRTATGKKHNINLPARNMYMYVHHTYACSNFGVVGAPSKTGLRESSLLM